MEYSTIQSQYFIGIYCLHNHDLIALIMKAVCTSDMLVYFFVTTQRYVPEGCYLYTCCCGNL